MSRTSYLRIGSPPQQPSSYRLRRRRVAIAAVFGVFVLGMWVSYLLLHLPPN